MKGWKSHARLGGLSPFVVATLSVMAFLLGASFCFLGDEWHNTSAFYYVNHFPFPWWFYGAALCLAGVLLLFDEAKHIGFLIGGIVYSVFSILLWLSVLGSLHSHLYFLKSLHYPANASASVFAACNVTTISVLYWSALFSSINNKFDPDKQKLAEAVEQREHEDEFNH